MNRKSKPFRHSSTFYRKVNKLIKVPHNQNIIRNLQLADLSSSSSSYPGAENSHNIIQGNCGETRNSSNDNNEPSNSCNIIRENLNEMLDTITHSCEDTESIDSESEPCNSEKMTPGAQPFFDSKDKIRQWALKFQICHNALNVLLDILRENPNMNFLPKDSRSLLQTPRKNNIISMENGQYWYNGIENCLKDVVFQSFTELPSKISLTFNIDGLPIAKSSKNEFWPILCKIDQFSDIRPIVIAMYYGNKKPPVNDFLRPFVDELNSLLSDGIRVRGRIVHIKIRCFICDTPARSFIKGTVGFNSYHGCMKCTIIGEYDRKGRHMSFPRTDMPLRTDHSFRNRVDPDHHKQKTAIEDLPINLVDDFTIADALHLLELGVMKRCLVGWTSGSFNFRCKWSANDIQTVSKKLMELKTTTCSEVHQGRMRELDTIHFWKAAEFKNFLLYFGPVVLKQHLTHEVYQHFLSLFCATTICSTDAYKPFLHIAQTLFEDYIEKFIDIYGEDSVSSNIHNLCHVVNDVSRFGPLPTLSAYPFESMLFKIKNLLRNGNQPLAQVANRLQELSQLVNTNDDKETRENYPFLKHVKLLISGEKVFSTVCMGRYILSCNNKDRWFLSNDNDIIAMEHAVLSQNEIKIIGKSVTTKFLFFERPFNSSHLNIYTTSVNYETEDMKIYLTSDIKCKLISLKCENKIVFLPVLQTLQV